MNASKEASSDDMLEYIGALPWDVVLCGFPPSNEVAEERFLAVPGAASAAKLIHFYRSNPDTPHIFTIGPEDDLHQGIGWMDVQATLAKFINGESLVLVDVTSLELECLLYLFHPLARLGPHRVRFSYTIPRTYAQSGRPETPAFEFQEIQQLKGFLAFPPEDGCGRPVHAFILGFDQGRADKFRLRYGWPDQDLRVLLGAPAYTPKGVETASAAHEKLIADVKRVDPSHYRKENASNPAMTRRALQEFFQSATHLDIIPIGPKPMVLGALFFYFSLPAEQREKVRILFDFPRPRPGRTSGVQDVLLFECDDLL